MSQFPYQTTFDVQCVENGYIVRQTRRNGFYNTLVYENRGIRNLTEVVGRDIRSLLAEAQKEQSLTHFKISVTIEDLTEEGGAL